MSDIKLKSRPRRPAVSADQAVLNERGSRLKRVRLMMDLSRKAFSRKYGISSGTLRGWEDGITTGLTDKNIHRLMPVFKEAGVHCSIGWLLHGAGSAPVVPKTKHPETTVSSESPLLNTDTAIAAEIELFCKHHPQQAIYMQVSDDGMEPYYREGEYVAGARLFGDAIDSVIGQHCIVETQMGEILLRLVRAGSKKDCYTLQCLNSLTHHLSPTLFDVALISAAPVVWYRRRTV
jgi:transcriptional regulator with XRE-family HTH domain